MLLLLCDLTIVFTVIAVLLILLHFIFISWQMIILLLIIIITIVFLIIFTFILHITPLSPDDHHYHLNYSFYISRSTLITLITNFPIIVLANFVEKKKGVKKVFLLIRFLSLCLQD